MDALVVLIPLLPFCAALLIGIGILTGRLEGVARESFTSTISLWSVSMSGLLALTLFGAELLGRNRGIFNLGVWLQSDLFTVSFNFITQGIGVRLSVLFGILLIIVFRFAVNYMHKETGFHRFYFVLALFSSGIQLLVLSGNAVAAFVGWEIAGLCSYLLIAYAYDRSIATTNATRVFVTNRIGDAGFIIGIGLSFEFAESVDWLKLNDMADQLSPGEATGLALCFALAAFAKSAQLPFTPWLTRALEGPTPSSAIFYGSVMVHAGIFLICLLEPLFEQSSFAMGVLVVVGAMTALYSFLIGLTQSDIKSSLAAATSAQIGLMFMECGLGFWDLAGWHLCAHAIVRAYQFLSAPSLIHHVHGNSMGQVAPWIAKRRWLYVASLQRFWLEPFFDWTLIKPLGRLSHDLAYFDDSIIDRAVGSTGPAIGAISSLAQYEEQKIGARLDNDSDQFAKGSGLAGKLTEWTAAMSHAFEQRFVLRNYGKNAGDFGRQIGKSFNRFEDSILRPRYLVLFVFITLLIAF